MKKRKNKLVENVSKLPLGERIKEFRADQERVFGGCEGDTIYLVTPTARILPNPCAARGHVESTGPRSRKTVCTLCGAKKPHRGGWGMACTVGKERGLFG